MLPLSKDGLILGGLVGSFSLKTCYRGLLVTGFGHGKGQLPTPRTT